MLQKLEEVMEIQHLEGDVIHNIVEEYYRNLQQWKENNDFAMSLKESWLHPSPIINQD